MENMKRCPYCNKVMAVQAWSYCDDFSCEVAHKNKKMNAWRKAYGKLNRQRKTVLQYNKRNPLKPKILPPIVSVNDTALAPVKKKGFKKPRYGNQLWKELLYEDYLWQKKKDDEASQHNSENPIIS